MNLADSGGTRSHATEYGAVDKSFHWLVLFLLIAQFTIAWTMPHIGRAAVDEGLIAWHLSLGTTILFVVLCRVVWRSFHPVKMLPSIPAWQQVAARVTHTLLYLLLLLLPILGWIAAGFRGWEIHLLGIIPLPQLGPTGARWAHTAGDVHTFLSYVLLGFIALHVLAALYHHLIARDGVLRRMLPGI